MTRCPYSFPARSKRAMLAAIRDMGNPYWEGHTCYPFSWNVKAPYPFPMTAAELNPFHYDGGAFDAGLDAAWEKAWESGDRFNWMVEDMRDRADEYSTWPGDDGGSFKFQFVGRQGGHMVLESAFGFKLKGLTLAEMVEDIMPDWPLANIRRLYRALVCMTADFAPDKVREEYAHAIAYERFTWEEEQQEARAASAAAFAAELEASRPGMYQPA
jgi:hypothetical protein